MPKKTKRPQLILTVNQRNNLTKISNSLKSPSREVQRAKILLKYHSGENIKSICESLGITKRTVYKCIDKALAMGAESGLKDKYHRPKEPVITQEAKAWVVNLACTKPKELGYAAELWTHKALASHTRKNVLAAGHVCLKNAAKATIQRILKAQPLQPHKIKYYLEKRDPEFEKKMKEVLIVYQEVNLQNDDQEQVSNGRPIITVSVDEKPGIQAIQNVASDLPPDAKKYPQIVRDYEYKRLGTLSLLASLDLHDGYINALVYERHRSREFISLLDKLDSYYSKNCVIRLILDNHSSHVSKETMAYLATKPNRFMYVHTPKHGSWLNLVETFFSKISKSFLKGIRVDSLQELHDRIIKGISEINEFPVVHRWKNFEFADANIQ